MGEGKGEKRYRIDGREMGGEEEGKQGKRKNNWKR